MHIQNYTKRERTFFLSFAQTQLFHCSSLLSDSHCFKQFKILKSRRRRQAPRGPRVYTNPRELRQTTKGEETHQARMVQRVQVLRWSPRGSQVKEHPTVEVSFRTPASNTASSSNSKFTESLQSFRQLGTKLLCQKDLTAWFCLVFFISTNHVPRTDCRCLLSTMRLLVTAVSSSLHSPWLNFPFSMSLLLGVQTVSPCVAQASLGVVMSHSAAWNKTFLPSSPQGWVYR